MYRISNQKRKYSATPIVRVVIDENGKEQEEMVVVAVETKKLGDAISQKIVDLLNQEESEQVLKHCVAPMEIYTPCMSSKKQCFNCEYFQ